MIKPVVLIRTDGNSIIGYGHAMRMMALAEIIVSNFDICFVIRDTSEWLISEIKLKYSILEIPAKFDLTEEIVYLSSNLPNFPLIVILDGYNFDTSYQKVMRDKMKLKVISIDDFQPYKYAADVVINHAGLLTPKQFDKEPYTKLFLGPQYALLRKEFNDAAKLKGKVFSKVDTAFVCLGGTDPDLYKHIVVKLLEKSILRIIIIVSNKDKFDSLESISKGIELYSNLNAKDMIALMNQSDIAVLSASTLCYEYCSVSGGLFVIQTAENQKYIHNFVIKSGCGLAFDAFDEVLDSEDCVYKINNQILKQRTFFNGDNTKLLKKIITKTALEHHLSIRRASLNDLMQYFEWANDPSVRSNSFNSKTIELDNHVSWFNKKIKDKDSYLYIIYLENINIGQVRFDKINNEFVVDYSLDSYFRGVGLGEDILNLAINKLIQEIYMHITIVGLVKCTNLTSCKTFEKMLFDKQEERIIEGSKYFVYKLYKKFNS
jgi:UDP-2,4-diacetamido-2,4,6-trideoxy-beta-L-altropyranose hydrolase